MSLNPKQIRFVEEYLKDLNASAATKRAGYSERTADVQGSRLLANVKIQEAIAQRQAQRAQQVEVDAQSVLKEFACIAFSDLMQVFHMVDGALRVKSLNEWPSEIGRSLASIKVKQSLEQKAGKWEPMEIIEFRMHSKPEALKMLAQHLGLLKSTSLQIDEAEKVVVYLPDNGRNEED